MRDALGLASDRVSPRHLSPQFCMARLAACALVVCAAATASAESTRRTSRRSLPATTARAAPDITGTIGNGQARKPTGAPRAVLQDDETLPPPFNLPLAPRARMRACGEQWQEIKMSGKAADQTWREFATKCLVETMATGPAHR